MVSTITLNRTVRWRSHRDSGDFRLGLGAMVVVEHGEGYQGGLLVFPEYKLAVNVRHGDMLLSDLGALHGNSPILGSERLRVVAYCRTRMRDCSTFAEEYDRAKRQQPVDEDEEP